MYVFTSKYVYVDQYLHLGTLEGLPLKTLYDCCWPLDESQVPAQPPEMGNGRLKSRIACLRVEGIGFRV